MSWLLLALLSVEVALAAALAALSARAALAIDSRTLRLLALSFALLALSSVLRLAWLLLDSGPALAASSALMAAAFFALAVSHVYSVPRGPERLPELALLPAPILAAYSLGEGVSLYLALYAAVETTIFYVESGYRASLEAALGLYALFASLLLGFTAVGIGNAALVAAAQVAGFALLLSSGLQSLRAGGGG
ncbi:MAG: hypothetical protein RXP27_00125 [Nitrososphaeria archaeon]